MNRWMSIGRQRNKTNNKRKNERGISASANDLNLSIKCLELFVVPKETKTETASAKNTP
jgi:hypothetical protein